MHINFYAIINKTIGVRIKLLKKATPYMEEYVQEIGFLINKFNNDVLKILDIHYLTEDEYRKSYLEDFLSYELFEDLESIQLEEGKSDTISVMDIRHLHFT